ncbi:MAG TPA: MarR family transcriptional regulator [Solirubrobacteraceae bacterium]|nr:MarR family transcriptional regulator [Solirubrobacteraceae bacterium]
MGAGDSASGTAVPSDAELAGLVEHLVGELWWKVSSELPTELSRTAASILKYLREHGPQRVTSLATREQVAQPTMSVILKRLGARGLVERRVDPDDRRATLVAITPLGLETLSERARLRSGWFASRLAGLEGDDRRAVAAAVSKLMETFG